MSYKFDRFAERQAKREAAILAEEESLMKQRRLEGRSTWEKIKDLSESDELKSVLWELLEQRS